MTTARRRFDSKFERFKARLIVALSISLFAVSTQAHQLLARESLQQSTKAETTEARSIQAIRVSDAIKIDGVLDEAAWTVAQPATDFRQERPTEGAPASERTEVRVLFDDKNIYFGIRAFDSDAAHINARELVRDASFRMTIPGLASLNATLFINSLDNLLTNHDPNLFRTYSRWSSRLSHWLFSPVGQTIQKRGYS
jgi:hypothetical protein